MKKEEKDKLYKEYGIYHFRVPTPFERENAIGLFGEKTTFYKIISHEYTGFYQPIPPPGKNDWLMAHKEYGQTFLEYTKFGINQIEKGKDVIYIAPLVFNINDCLDQSFITGLVLICQAYFHDVKVKILDLEMDLEGVEYREYEDYKYQLNGNTLIEKLFNKMPDDGYCLVCFTDCDLYNDVRVIKPRDYIYDPPYYKNDFCYELNSFKHHIGVISLSRFDPLYVIEDPPDTENCKIQLYFILLKRVAKTLIKNICHHFGLKNCIFFSCVMNGFNNMSEFDKRPFELCPVCLRKLFTNICTKHKGRVSNHELIIERFKKVNECLKENFCDLFEKETKWYTKRIASIEKEIFGINEEENKEI